MGRRAKRRTTHAFCPSFFFFFSWPQTSRWELFKYSKAVPILPALFTTLTRSLHWNKSNSGEIRFVYRLDPPFAGSHGDEPSPSLPSIQFNLTSAIKSIGQRPLCAVNLLIIVKVELDSAFLSDATGNPLTKIKIFEC